VVAVAVVVDHQAWRRAKARPLAEPGVVPVVVPIRAQEAAAIPQAPITTHHHITTHITTISNLIFSPPFSPGNSTSQLRLHQQIPARQPFSRQHQLPLETQS
jgi:hypothetical protein